LTSVTSVLLDALGLDADELEWQDIAICTGQPIELFYEAYESSERTAKTVDSMCLSCPVRSLCLQAGVEGSEWGVWGGVFLTNGKMDEKRNIHKTQDIWEEIRSGVGV
jgi:hypothetical protein